MAAFALLAFVLIGLVGLTDRVAIVLSKNRVLSAIGIGGFALLVVGYALDAPTVLWIGAGLVALLTVFLLAAG